MFRDLDAEELAALYEKYGRADDEKVEMLARQFDTTPSTVPLESVMTSAPRVVAHGELLPLILIDSDYQYEVQQGVVVVYDKIMPEKPKEICRIGVGDARDFYSGNSHIPVGGVYLRKKVAPFAERAPLPPTRLDPTVTGQLKILIDVAIMLPHIKQGAEVVVVGSANMQSLKYGESYGLLEGVASLVRLIDPTQTPAREVRNGTTFEVIRQAQKGSVCCTAFFNDAATSEMRGGKMFVTNAIVPFVADIFSVKCAGSGAEQKRTADMYRKMGKKFFPYRQLSATHEWRLTSHPRYVGQYKKRLGSCAACVEIDYHLPEDFTFTDVQYRIIRDVHAYGQVKCSMTQSSRPVDHEYVTTVAMRTSFRPLYLSPEVELSGDGEPFDWEHREQIKITTHLVGSSVDIGTYRFFFSHQQTPTPELVLDRLCGLKENYQIPDRFKRQSVVYLPLGKREGRLAEITGTWRGLLILDSFAYELDYIGYTKEDGLSPPPQGGLFPTEQPVTKWWVSRFGAILHRGLTAVSLVAAITIVLRNRQYLKFGYY